MKMKKILTLVIMVSSLLIASTSIVTAIDETKTILDEEDDVVSLDYYTMKEETYDYPNIDITKIEYEREDTNIKITITVNGEIENLGETDYDPSDPYKGLGNMVMYQVILTTSFDVYYIMYMNNNCSFASSYEEISITDFSIIDRSSLEMNFNLNNSDETYDSISVDASYLFIDVANYDFVAALDTAGDLPLSVEAYGTSLGEVGVEIEFVGIVEGGQSPYEYLWDFGDGETSNEQYPMHTYDKPETYEYTFTVTDASGASDSYTDEVEILGDEDDDNTPGFELVIAIVAIGIILFLKRRRYQ